MPIKLQNCLFLIGSSFVGQLAFVYIGFFVLLHLSIKEWILDLIFDTFLPIGIILSIINLCNNKVTQYIYTRSKKYLPRLQWYSMFLAWIPIINEYIKINNFDVMTAAAASCTIASLCYPNRTWKKRLKSTLFFAFLLFFCYLCEYTSFKDF